MNSRRALLCLALAAIASTAISAQSPVIGSDTIPDALPDAPWRLVYFAAGDPTATDIINETIAAGLVPVGMEISHRESLGLLFARADSISVESWALIDYDDWNAIEDEITGGIRDGFIPMDISRYAQTLAILWIKADMQVEGWRMSTSPDTVIDRSRTVNDFQNQGFTLWGISVHEDLVWYLFLRLPGTPSTSAISAFARDAETLREALLDADSTGWVPNGLGGSADSVHFCFTR